LNRQLVIHARQPAGMRSCKREQVAVRDS
jgi:hypothetical protein